MKNKYGYPNEVDNKIVKKLKWEILNLSQVIFF